MNDLLNAMRLLHDHCEATKLCSDCPIKHVCDEYFNLDPAEWEVDK